MYNKKEVLKHLFFALVGRGLAPAERSSGVLKVGGTKAPPYMVT